MKLSDPRDLQTRVYILYAQKQNILCLGCYILKTQGFIKLNNDYCRCICNDYHYRNRCTDGMYRIGYELASMRYYQQRMKHM